MYFIWYLLIGLAAGWLANLIVKAAGPDFVNLIVGILGGILGGWVLSLIGWVPVGTLGSLATAVIGALLLLWIAALISRRKHAETRNRLPGNHKKEGLPCREPSLLPESARHRSVEQTTHTPKNIPH